MITRGAAAAALTLTVLAGTSVTVKAQSNATGYLYGSAPNGATVVVENLPTGLRREARVGDTGAFSVAENSY